jgi:hypothetical protein
MSSEVSRRQTPCHQRKTGGNLGGRWMTWINNFRGRALVWAKSRLQTWHRRQSHHWQRNAWNVDAFGPDGARLLYSDFGLGRPWPPGSKLFRARHSRQSDLALTVRVDVADLWMMHTNTPLETRLRACRSALCSSAPGAFAAGSF